MFAKVLGLAATVAGKRKYKVALVGVQLLYLSYRYLAERHAKRQKANERDD